MEKSARALYEEFAECVKNEDWDNAQRVSREPGAHGLKKDMHLLNTARRIAKSPTLESVALAQDLHHEAVLVETIRKIRQILHKAANALQESCHEPAPQMPQKRKEFRDALKEYCKKMHCPNFIEDFSAICTLSGLHPPSLPLSQKHCQLLARLYQKKVSGSQKLEPSWKLRLSMGCENDDELRSIAASLNTALIPFSCGWKVCEVPDQGWHLTCT